MRLNVLSELCRQPHEPRPRRLIRTKLIVRHADWHEDVPVIGEERSSSILGMQDRTFIEVICMMLVQFVDRPLAQFNRPIPHFLLELLAATLGRGAKAFRCVKLVAKN